MTTQLAQAEIGAEDPLLTTEQLAQYLNVAMPTIYMWRSHRKGPPGRKMGGKFIRYRKSEVDAWIASQPTEAA